MSETIIFQTLLFAWPDAKVADEVSKEIRYNHLLRGLTITDHATVRHEANGKVKIEARNRSTVGALAGAGTGAVVGLIGGPIGMAIMAGVGSLVGAWLGRDAGRPVSGAELMALGHELPRGSSALLMLVGQDDVPRTISAMERFDAQVANLTAGPLADAIVIGEPVPDEQSADTRRTEG